MFWGTNVYKDVPDFLFFGHKDVSDFFRISSKTIFFIFFLLLRRFKNLGVPFHLGALGNGLIGLVEGPALNQLLF